MTGKGFEKIIIVGAGPSGLLLALLLSKHGIPVTVVEMSHELDQQPRAAHYGPAATPDLKRAGVLDKIKAEGMTLDTMCWRRSDDHGYIAGFDAEVISNVDGNDLRTVCLPLQDLDKLMLDLFVEKYNGNILWKHKVVDVGQDEKKAWIDVETPNGNKRLEADYIIGCDGANSAVRRALFGNDYPGFTWDAQIIATNTYYDFEGKFGFDDANFIIHPENFFVSHYTFPKSESVQDTNQNAKMAAKITRDGLYRVTYGETPGLSVEEYKQRQPWKFETMLPGHPKPDEYKLINFAPYKMHQRCATKFRVGRVLLAADAAHLCNPWGGLGITGGFVDCGGLYDCLAGIWDGKADESILELYSEKRIEKWNTVIDPISQENFRRVSDKDPATRYDRDEFMHMLTKGQTDKAFLKDLLMGSLDVRYDFTQHYHSAVKVA